MSSDGGPTMTERYTSDAADGKRGRCGRQAPPIDGVPPTCNPDDENAHCCSNGGYCGNSKEHCECVGCVDFSKTRDFMYKPTEWWTYAENPENAAVGLKPNVFHLEKSRNAIRQAKRIVAVAPAIAALDPATANA
ncbi:hypothetical protein ANCCEY_13696 [Ancylostoma ceylanicum]|uniref:Chitin-binding type-1 domain-containing protein n=1 Tax=Ancylostoma ceylanicum TaxID=53326 RepID=A0A0D6L871_9BILA|nr:hypothetical protein ANCCEY_13696 [Ancylostoma ceylanicum]